MKLTTELTVENLLWSVEFLTYLNRLEQILGLYRFGGGYLYTLDPKHPLGGFYVYRREEAPTCVVRSYLPHLYTLDNLRENLVEMKKCGGYSTLIQEIEEWIEKTEQDFT